MFADEPLRQAALHRLTLLDLASSKILVEMRDLPDSTADDRAGEALMEQPVTEPIHLRAQRWHPKAVQCRRLTENIF